MTNREKLNRMTNEELAKFLDGPCSERCIYSDRICSDYGCNCVDGVELWLGREAKEENAYE